MFANSTPRCLSLTDGFPKSFPGLFLIGICLIGLSLINVQACTAQMIRTETPFTTVGSSFYERIGIDFGFQFRGTPATNIGDRTRGVFGLGPGGQILPNLTFRQGSVNSAVPAFGGYDPNADATFGYNYRNGSGGYHLGLRMGKGNTRTISNTTPVIVTRNGVTGNIFNGTQTPFVTGIIPVVGNGGVPFMPPSGYTTIHPLELKLRQLHMDRGASASNVSQKERYQNLPERVLGNPDSSATRGDLSVKEIKRRRKIQQEQEQDALRAKSESYYRKAQSALKDGETGAARSYLRNAIRFAPENIKPALQKKLDEILD